MGHRMIIYHLYRENIFDRVFIFFTNTNAHTCVFTYAYAYTYRCIAHTTTVHFWFKNLICILLRSPGTHAYAEREVVSIYVHVYACNVCIKHVHVRYYVSLPAALGWYSLVGFLVRVFCYCLVVQPNQENKKGKQEKIKKCGKTA